MGAMEQKFACSGFCKSALFWFTKDINSVPSKACKESIIKEIGSGYTVPGVIVIIAAILVLIIFLF